ncbi:MAG: GIY-YIG nuclease family protein [Dongiaceae bacterium]
MSYWTYFLCNKPRGTFYIGMTGYLVKRVAEHRDGVVEGFTKRYGVKRLVYFEEDATALEAIKREKTLKRWPRAWKIALVERSNPHWDDLFESIAQ